MAMKESAILFWPEYQVFQNNEWQWVSCHAIGSEAAQTYEPFFNQAGDQVYVYEVPNSCLDRNLRIGGLHSDQAANWLIKCSMGFHPNYFEMVAELDGNGHFSATIPAGELQPDGQITIYISYADTTPPPMQPVEKIGVYRIKARDF